jgi:hypothetical protein
MARGRKRKTYRKKDKAINLVNAAEAAIQTNTLIHTATNLDLPQFIFGRTQSGGLGNSGFAWGQSNVSARELFTRTFTENSPGGPTQIEIVMDNLKSNWFDGLWKVGATRVGFAVGKKISAPARRQVNKMLKWVGLRDFVKV